MMLKNNICSVAIAFVCDQRPNVVHEPRRAATN